MGFDLDGNRESFGKKIQGKLAGLTVFRVGLKLEEMGS